MRTRIVSGAVITVLAVVCGIFGGALLGAVLWACSLVAYDELLKATGATENGKTLHLLSVCGCIATTFYYALIVFFETSGLDILPDDIISRTILTILVTLFLAHTMVIILSFLTCVSTMSE